MDVITVEWGANSNRKHTKYLSKIPPAVNETNRSKCVAKSLAPW